MKQGAVLGMLIVLLAFCQPADAFESSSTNYQTTKAVISSGGGNSSSTNYQTDQVTGIPIGNQSSTSYTSQVGFFFGFLEAAAEELTYEITFGLSLGMMGLIFIYVGRRFNKKELQFLFLFLTISTLILATNVAIFLITDTVILNLFSAMFRVIMLAMLFVVGLFLVLFVMEVLQSLKEGFKSGGRRP